jgi:glycerol-1-phosphate dehydrogenase [NAD(P)+]
MSSLSQDLTDALPHPKVEVDALHIGPGALDRLTEVIGAPGQRIAYLVDESTFVTSADPHIKETVEKALRAHGEVHRVTLPGSVHADEVTVEAAAAGVAGADVVVTFGSGTLADIGKVAAVTNGAAHVIVQSAASVNGFADDQSVLLINGVKRTAHSAWPNALVIDTDVVSHAPVALNASGLGDMISMFTAPADWYLSSLFQMDRGWNPEAAVLTRRHGDELLGIAPGIGAGDADAARTLSEFVTLSGFSMGIAGQTSPSSGMEHTVSHMFDMRKGATHADTAYHGAQVGVATIAVSLLWRRMAERLAAGGLTEFRILTDEQARERIVAAFGWMDESGSVADECWRDYSAKLTHLRSIDAAEILARIQDGWESIHAPVLETMLIEPERIVAALDAAGAPTRFSELNVPHVPEEVVWSLLNCHLMRNRFTIADLAFATGFWEEADVMAVLDEAARLGAGV